MKPFSLRQALMVLVLMLAAAGLAVAAKPRMKMADQGPRIDLETMIPSVFGDWKIDPSIVPIEPSPEVKAKLEAIYNQTLSRTYIDGRGRRVMLSIAYGGAHGEAMQTHRPEVCYPAQGFNVVREFGMQALATVYGALNVKRLVASYGPRVEPITYWVVVGDMPTAFGVQMKLAQLRYNITGQIPDGMLVRVSSIDRNELDAYQVQEQFIVGLLAALSDRDRARIIGSV
jgi:EpsI family protein